MTPDLPRQGESGDYALHVMFGGTFDPVHNGHLRMAVELGELLRRTCSPASRLHLVPAHVPPHRDSPGAASQHRLAMLRLATDGEPGLIVDPRELESEGRSYSVDTLVQLRRELGAAMPLAMVVGSDAFSTLHRWDRWREIPELAHIIVIQRPGPTMSPGSEPGQLLAERRAEDPMALVAAPSGRVLPVTQTLLDISATDIRRRIAAGLSPRYLLPDAVWGYIREHSLYRHEEHA